MPGHTANQSKSEEKKCSTGQRFICTKVTSYKIHTLVLSENSMFKKSLKTGQKITKNLHCAAVAAVVIHFHFLVVQFFALVLVVLGNYRWFSVTRFNYNRA